MATLRNFGHHPREKPSPDRAVEESFQRESEVRFDQSKQWALACLVFASAHADQLPKDVEQLKAYAPGLSETNWEIVSRGAEKGIINPSQTILLREKEPRQSPDRKFVKVYAFADGHAEMLLCSEHDFSILEKERGLLIQSAKN